jgi:hypothetical protein
LASKNSFHFNIRTQSQSCDLEGTYGFGGDDLPRPRIIVIAYIGHRIFSKDFPPTFIMVARMTASFTCQRWIEVLKT